MAMRTIYGEPLPSTLYKYRSVVGEELGWLQDMVIRNRFFWPTPAVREIAAQRSTPLPLFRAAMDRNQFAITIDFDKPI